MLPISYTIPSHLLTVGSDPFAQGPYGDVYEGTLNDSKVCIKRVRMYTQEGPEKAIKVRRRRCCFPCPPLLTKFADLLPRGRNMETFVTYEHNTPAGYHHHSLSAHFQLDVWRGPSGIHQEAPRCRAACTRGCRSCDVYPMLTSITSCATSQRGSATSIPAMWFTEILGEYVVVLDPVKLLHSHSARQTSL